MNNVSSFTSKVNKKCYRPRDALNVDTSMKLIRYKFSIIFLIGLYVLSAGEFG